MARLVQQFTILILVEVCWEAQVGGQGIHFIARNNYHTPGLLTLFQFTLSKKIRNKLKMASHYSNSVWEIYFAAKLPHLIHLIPSPRRQTATLPFTVETVIKPIPPQAFISSLCEMYIEKKTNRSPSSLIKQQITSIFNSI